MAGSAASSSSLRQEIARLSADLAAARRESEGYRNLLVAAAHEMRTPLNAILLLFDMIARQSDRIDESALKLHIERAKRVLEGYVGRTSVLLDTARLSGDVFKLDYRPVALEGLVSAVTDLYAAKAEYHGTRMDVDIAPGLVGRWDRAAVETILTNLVSNALKYGEGTPVVISAKMVDDNAVIRIADVGPGIPGDQRERIFEKFNRATQSSTKEGYGLGLWIARKFAQLHGGSLMLAPTSSGSTFVVTLPVEQAMTAGRVA